LIIFFLFLCFALGQVWKAQQVAQLCEKIDRLRSEQEDLYQQYLTLQLKFDDLASYPAIEPLAKEKLGMHASPRPPIVIRPVEESLLAYKRSYP
jgi:cell division protein FtsL